MSRAVHLAHAMGKIMEDQDIRDCGAALGVLLGSFIYEASKGMTTQARNDGIDAIAQDAKNFATLLSLGKGTPQ